MRAVRDMAVIGGNGAMGSQSGSLFAQAGVRCVFCAPTLEEARTGIERAVEQARSVRRTAIEIGRIVNLLEGETEHKEMTLVL